VLRLAATLLALAGCYRHARPDPRVADLEARLAAQDQTIAELRAQSPTTVELAALASRIEALSAQIVDLQGKLAKAPAAKPERRAPNPSLVYAVPVGTSAVEGHASAKVTLVMAFDFACRYCRRVWDTVEALRAKYKTDLRVVYKHYVVHATAMRPAQAACAATRQGKFHKLAQLLWVKSFDVRKFDDAHIDKLAKEAKLDLRRYREDVESCLVDVTDDGALMRRLAVSATPTFFINGRFLEGAKDEAAFSALIDEELAKAGAAIKAGVPADKIYEQQVLARGLHEVPSS
jgi:protein-disulfide isomerase